MTQAAERTEGIAEKTLRTLEYDKVLERLAAHTSFSLGRALALASRPTTVHAEVVRLQRMTAEARHLATQRGFSLGGAKDVRSLVEKAALGGVLDPGELLDIRGTLEAAAGVQSFVQRTVGMTPLLADLVDEIEPLPSIVTEIARSIDERAEVMDAASPALGALRREVRSLHDTLVARVESIMRDSFDRGVAQEPIVTQRDGRYVIPVKADARGQLPGVVHDVSASGATVFVEPLAVIELANRWREAQLEERREVERVLRRLSADVGSETSAIVRNIEILGELDVAIARARYAEELHAPLPSLNDGPVWVVEAPAELRLLEARHPLLSGHVVPVTILVGSEDARILLITGPNTGGKTVALKTAGLLVLMAQSGMGVPAEEGSQLPVYESVLADIGDEQSIEQSLSTFSGHISNIVQILAQAGPRSLVLLDELAAGTDPAEGAPLARAILTELLERRATVLATTHHGELKTFAHETPGIVNASVEFDPDTLAPTYRLRIGLPGGSNAFAIARRLGMPERLVGMAEESVSPEQLRLEQLLAEAQRERDQLARERRAEMLARREAEEIRDALHQRMAAIEAERDALMNRAHADIDRDVRQARRALRQVERELARGDREAVRRAASGLELAQEAADRIERHRSAGRRPSGPIASEVVDRIVAGDRIWLAGLDQPGEALGPPDDRGEIEVMLGALRTRVRKEQVEKVAGAGARPVIEVVRPLAPAASPGDEIEVRGQTIDEALPAIESFLDLACRAGLPAVRIIHGKGTGTLRRAVRDLLGRHPLVRSFETPPPNQGGEGVTIAHFTG